MLKRSALFALPIAVLVASCAGSDDATPATDEVTDSAGSVDTAVTDSAAPDSAVELDVAATTNEPIVDDEPTTDDGDTATPVASAGSCDDVAASFLTEGSANANLADPEVAATCDGGSVVVTSNGIPDYTYIETSPGSPRVSELEFSIPAEPTFAAETTAVPLVGSAAIATNGIPIYGPTEGTGGDVLSLGGALSECGSHNGPTGFHFHIMETTDTTDCLFSPEELAEGPVLVGYAFDGFPIYATDGLYESSWELTDESQFASDTWAAHSFVEGSGDLDECNGLTDADGNYAYYATETFPYVIGCYSGVVELDGAGGGGGELGGPPGDGGPEGDDQAEAPEG